MAAKKRHFTEVEKNLLAQCLLPYKEVIENKKTDGATNKQKTEAWDAVSQNYNNSSIINEKATTKQLQTLWANLKQRRRMEIAKHRQLIIITGGGPPPPPLNDSPIIDDIAPHLLVEVEGANDSETITLTKEVEEKAQTPGTPPITSDGANYDSVPSTSSSTLDPQHLSTEPTLSKTPSTKNMSIKMAKRSLLEAVANEQSKRTKSLADFDEAIYEEKVATEKAKRREAETVANINIEIAKLRKREAEANAKEAEFRMKIAQLEYEKLCDKKP